jgi:hypothetical protein
LLRRVKLLSSTPETIQTPQFSSKKWEGVPPILLPDEVISVRDLASRIKCPYYQVIYELAKLDVFVTADDQVHGTLANRVILSILGDSSKQ